MVVRHDAHLVKYTLACLDAMAADPPAARLYLAAAATLLAFWTGPGHEAFESDDPLAAHYWSARGSDHPPPDHESA